MYVILIYKKKHASASINKSTEIRPISLCKERNLNNNKNNIYNIFLKFIHINILVWKEKFLLNYIVSSLGR